MAENQDKEQRTEQATPRRREEARDKGQVAVSTELTAAFGLAAGMAALLVGGGGLVHGLGGLIVESLGRLAPAARSEFGVEESAGIIRGSLESVAVALGMVVVPTAVCLALAGYAQVGFRVAPKAVEADLSKVDPIKGFQRLFSLRAVVRTGFAALKVLAITLTMGLIAWHQLGDVVRLGDGELGPLLVGLGRVALLCTAGALVTILAIGLIDLFFQRYQHEKDLRMTRQELKEEHRLTEGDPHVRSRVRQLQREMATRRMMSEVPKATVVVTNPTHYAVALKYERDAAGRALQSAPLVVAKGKGHVAQRIKQVAAEANVYLYEDVPLARSLYAEVELGREIPEELYAAVATVLGHVFRLQGEVVGAS